MSGLDNLRSVFQDELNEKAELFRENQPIDKFDTKLNYNESVSNSQTFTFSANLTQRGGRDNPLLDSVLRGRVYEPIRFSQDFVNDNLFVKPETGEITNQLFKTQKFDPREDTPKLGTLYFNTGNSFNPATNPTDFSTAVGNNNLPYIPLTELGGQFKEFLSWENLYNSNHTPKNEPKYKGISVVNYGPNVSRDNLKIGQRDHVIGNRYGFSRGNEPYVISPIGNDGRELNKGNRSIPITRALTDTDRILNFLTSGQGIAFALQQNINIPIENTVVRSGDKLIRTPQRFGVTYNPLSSIAASAARLLGQSVPNVLIRKAGVDLDILPDLLKPTEYGVSVTKDGFSINDTFTSGNSTDGGGLLSQLGNALSSLNPFDEGTPVSKISAGDKMTLAHMVTGVDLNNITSVFKGGTDKDPLTAFSTTSGQRPDVKVETALGFNPESAENGMPFYFKDLRDNKYIFFRAFIEGLTENISPSWSSHNYVGRSEPVYTYERGEREISFTLKLVAQTQRELVKIYEKMDKLTSMCYPQYVGDDYGNRMKPPLAKLRYGELYGTQGKELMGFIKSLSYAVENTSTYETGEVHITGHTAESNKKTMARVPRHIIATIGYQVIHDKTPSLDTKFYGIKYNV